MNCPEHHQAVSSDFSVLIYEDWLSQPLLIANELLCRMSGSSGYWTVVYLYPFDSSAFRG